MSFPNQELVRQVLGVNDRDILCRSAVESAWDTVNAEYQNRAWWRRKSTTRGVIWEHTIDEATNAFSGDTGVKVISHHDTASFLFDDQVLVRFKKAGLQLISSNFPTLLAQMYHRHDDDLFGHEGHHRVEVAHVFNRFETGLDWIGVVAREGANILWHFELRAPDAVVEPLPVPTHSTPAGERIVRAITQDSEEAEDGKGD